MLDIRWGFVFVGAIPAWSQFYVSASGNDAGPGSLQRPFRTLERARDALRHNRGRPQVFVRGGVYWLENTIEMDERDSGTAAVPVVYSAYKNESVILSGGRALDELQPVSDPAVAARFDEAYRDKVLEVDLHAAGIRDLGNIRAGGPAPLELFLGGRPMRLARWPNPSSPNRGWFQIAGVPDQGDGDRFIYVGGRPRLKHWDRASDAWMHGFWVYDWLDAFVPLKQVDFENQFLISDQSFVRARMANQVTGKVINRNPSSVGRRYYVFNILEELDEPGEYFVDRRSGKLYVWPPKGFDRSAAVVSLLQSPIVSMKAVSNLVWEGFRFENSRGNAIEIQGGSDIRIRRCRIRNVGGKAVTIVGGRGHRVEDSEIFETGDGGIAINAGDKITLTPSLITVRGNDIHDYSRRSLTYRAAVDIKGVGATVSHNHIHHAPHAGILLDGNDHRIEYNEFDHLCEHSDDCGAFYSNGLNWTARGTTVQFNSFHDIRGIGGKSQAPAVYLDDFAGSTRVFGNVFYRTFGVKIGGGRNNTVENNIFVDCDPAVSLDARGLTWASASVTTHRPAIQKQLDEVKYQEPPYRTRYPELLTLLDEEPGIPLGNRIAHNVFYGGVGWVWISSEVPPGATQVAENWKGRDPGFANADASDFRLSPGSPLYRSGFKPIAMEKIGRRIGTTKPLPAQ